MIILLRVYLGLKKTIRELRFHFRFRARLRLLVSPKGRRLRIILIKQVMSLPVLLLIIRLLKILVLRVMHNLM